VFGLFDEGAYRNWRDGKLDGYPREAADLVVEIRDPACLSPPEKARILDLCRRCNMAIYASDRNLDKDGVRALGALFGLRTLDSNLCADDDGITPLAVAGGTAGARQTYIPYTDKPIAWHTDGYYNGERHQVRGLLLHCVEPAQSGGENGLMDPDMAYILLREENPAYIPALSHPEAMTVPANEADGRLLRPEQTGPVFSVCADGRLHMRYTQRKRNILWRDDALTREAVEFLVRMLDAGNRYSFRMLLQAGQGLVCNNVLHMRTAFSDGSARQRLLYRARYYDRITSA